MLDFNYLKFLPECEKILSGQIMKHGSIDDQKLEYLRSFRSIQNYYYDKVNLGGTSRKKKTKSVSSKYVYADAIDNFISTESVCKIFFFILVDKLLML